MIPDLWQSLDIHCQVDSKTKSSWGTKAHDFVSRTRPELRQCNIFFILQQMADLIGEDMQDHGIKFIRNSVPKRVDKLEDSRLQVTYDSYEWGEEHSDIFDTVIMAVGMFFPVSIPFDRDAQSQSDKWLLIFGRENAKKCLPQKQHFYCSPAMPKYSNFSKRGF